MVTKIKPIEYIYCEFCESRTDTWHGITGLTSHLFYSCRKTPTPEGYRGKMEATVPCTLLDQSVCPKAQGIVEVKNDER